MSGASEEYPGFRNWVDLILISSLWQRNWRGIDLLIETFPYLLFRINVDFHECLFLCYWSDIVPRARKYGWKQTLQEIVFPWDLITMPYENAVIPVNNRQDLCHSCGNCCDPVELPTQEHIKKRIEKNGRGFSSVADLYFILSTLRPISREEAYRRNPHLKIKHQHLNTINENNSVRRISSEVPYTWYDCPYFERSMRRCTVHGTPFKPPLCRRYPLESGGPPTKSRLDPECGYNALVEVIDNSAGEIREKDVERSRNAV